MKQDSNMEAASTPPECEEKEVGISGVQKAKGSVSMEHEGKRKEAVSSAEQEDSMMKEDFPAEQIDDIKKAVTVVGKSPEARNSTEKCIEEESCKEKNLKVLKVKRKIIKKSPASSVLKTKKAQGEQEDDIKKTVTVVGKSPEARNSAEKCIEEESCKEKNLKVLTVKRKIIKKSPASSVLKTKKAQGEQEDDKKEKEVTGAQEVRETLEAQNPTENSSKPEPTTKKINKVLKVKRKIVKKSPASCPLKTNKVQSSPKVHARKRPENNKSVLQANGEGSEKKVEDTEKPNQKEGVSKSISRKDQMGKNEETSASRKRNSEFKNSIQERENTEKAGPSDKSIRNRMKKNNRKEKSQREDKNKEKLGGLIFMCSAKTKPDCFHYNVMGVSAGKKDVVLAIKPGLKLFLYDFDLRLLYGIYKASSSGGMKLEPKAFDGAFPAQVRFNVYKDCFPLPESIFKKAIQENYYEKHKFKVELTVKQVRKLTDLFRPVGLHSSSATVRSPPRVPIRDRKVHGEVKEVRFRDSKSKGDARNYRLLSHGRDRHQEEVPRHREEAPRDLYLSEKDYRTYGLRAERRNLDPVPRPTLETYHRDHDDRDYQLRHPEPRYRDDVSARREIIRADHIYFNGKDYPIYSIDSRPEVSPPGVISATSSERNAYDPYYTRQHAPLSIDPYLLPSRREEAAPPTYSARDYVVATEPMRHAAGALSYYNQMHHKQVETDTMPVSSRYSFAGPSFSYH